MEPNKQQIAPKPKKSLGRPHARDISFAVGQRIRDRRIMQNLSLEDVAESTRRMDPEERGISTGYLSRIERDKAMPSLQEAHWICGALDMDLVNLIQEDLNPWYVVRAQTAEERLAEVISGQRKIKRFGKEHEGFIERGYYRYVPLSADPDFAAKSEGKLRPRLQPYLFSATTIPTEEMVGGLDRHDAEEVVFCIDGALEFWFKQDKREKAERIVLTPGDCIHYNSNFLHGYRALASDAKAFFVVYTERPPQLITAVEKKGNT